MDFDLAERLQPVQAFDLQEDWTGSVEYPTRSVPAHAPHRGAAPSDSVPETKLPSVLGKRTVPPPHTHTHTSISKFQGVTSLTIYFPRARNADTTLVTYIGLKGEYKPVSARAGTCPGPGAVSLGRVVRRVGLAFHTAVGARAGRDNVRGRSQPG